ncbi:MAG: quinone-dependent dihydroorotate dehydrogenase [Chthonomonas sp.]|nr:quinone-dependent dihydroorotate dehydrogenase [Chthonomonas sp.]
MYEKLLRPVLFRLDAERAHNMGLAAVAQGLVRTKLVSDPRLRVSVLGLDFANPLGLAAGMDKNGVAVNHWHQLGFGHVEIGTVTPLAQPGNPQPRLFRIPEEQAVINRFGFNNEGAEAMARRLATGRGKLPLGINLGKNKATIEADAPSDYARGYAALASHADYVTVNVSSPNTPGLRSLQDIGVLRAIVEAMHSASDIRRPILLKLAPDLDAPEIKEICESARSLGFAGLILSNTTIRRDLLSRDPGEAGGLSGRPLRDFAQQVLEQARQHTDLPIIGVGGIFSAADVLNRLGAGASLVQLYTGWVYGGPGTCPRILLDILDVMKQRGANSLSELLAQS